MCQVFVLLKKYLYSPLTYTLECLNLIQDEEVEAYKREAERSREAADAAQDSLEAERQRLAASEARRENDERRGAAEAAVLREQLDNAVRGAGQTCC